LRSGSPQAVQNSHPEGVAPSSAKLQTLAPPAHGIGAVAPVTWAWTEVWDVAKNSVFRMSRVRKFFFMFLNWYVTYFRFGLDVV